MKSLILALGVLVMTGCNVSGEENVEIAPYSVLREASENNIEVRNYDSMILVSAPMGSGENGAFRKLFRYISGDNVDAKDIEMTAPVFLDAQQIDKSGVEIPMTAPVFMDNSDQTAPMMSFVMPADFTRDNTPVPIDGDLVVQEVSDYKVAVVRFSGRLSDSNIEKHRNLLEQWIVDNNYVVVGPVKTAGYNAPFTLPSARRNEVLIPVEKK
ncbi:MAG: heme-binding protein [Bdellovibrionales bacterium]